MTLTIGVVGFLAAVLLVARLNTATIFKAILNIIGAVVLCSMVLVMAVIVKVAHDAQRDTQQIEHGPWDNYRKTNLFEHIPKVKTVKIDQDFWDNTLTADRIK